MRQFKLINARGAEWDMMRRDAWLHDPSGLGFANDAQVMPLGGTFALLRVEAAAPAPAGEMIFAGYQQETDFRRFVGEGVCTLAYKPLDTWQYLDVIVSMDKSEIQPDTGLLVCTINFAATSHWYERATATNASPSGKRHGYPYTYPYRYKDGATGEIALQNGALPSYPKITILGPATNPSWTLYQSSQKLQSGKLLYTIPAGNRIVIDCRPPSMGILEYNDSGEMVADRYGDSDFSTARFLELPPGDSKIFLAQEGSGDVSGWVEVRRRV